MANFSKKTLSTWGFDLKIHVTSSVGVVSYHHASHCLVVIWGWGLNAFEFQLSIVATGSHQVSGSSARTAGVLSVSPSGHFCFSSPKAGSIGDHFADGTSCGIVPIKWPHQKKRHLGVK